ncbi:MAG: GNAT family N-acetyltransferase [Verrucomicrobiales bacterium]|nr:GNAT family N-acetyltransferase [Verrucomicrobiales bacterium]
MNSTGSRVAEASDAEAIAALSAELGYPADPKTTAARLSRILKDPSHHLLVAVQAPGEIAGWIHGFLTQLVESDYRVEIGGLIIGQRFQRRGLGTMLVRQLQQWGQSQGAVEVSVRCQIKRAEAHGFYQSLGFQLTKTQHVFRCRLRPIQD